MTWINRSVERPLHCTNRSIFYSSGILPKLWNPICVASFRNARSSLTSSSNNFMTCRYVERTMY